MSISELIAGGDAAAFTRDLLVKIGDATPELIYAKDTNSRMIFANRAVLETIGRTWEEIRGKSDDEWHSDPEEGRKFVEADAKVMKGGKAESLEEILTGQDGPQVYLSTKCPLTDENGTVIGLFGISMNITERKNDEKIRQILVNELDHRLKNTLAVVQAMARQTFRYEVIDNAVWATFEGRLRSMSSAHGLLARQTWVGADIADVVSDGLMAHDGDRFVTTGPSAWIDAQSALSLAMAMHELGTNAVKYGALSTSIGQVTISWSIEQVGDSKKLTLSWREKGGPAVVPPAKTGFGSRLISQTFGSAEDTRARIEYHPEGLVFRVSVALSEKVIK